MIETPGQTGHAQLIRERVKTPDAVKDHAFRTWLAYGRSWVAVARILACDESTLRRWSKADNWEARRLSELAHALPGVRTETAVALTLAAYDAAIRLQQIAHDAAHNTIIPHHREVDALTRILDRAGFAAINHTPLTIDRQGAHDPALDASSDTPLTRDQLIQREHDRRLSLKPDS